MQRVIELLIEKNEYLQKFQFVNEQELMNFVAGDFDNVEVFYQTRDKILDLVNCIDALIAEETQRMNTVPVTKDQSIQAEKLLNQKDQLVKAILAQDLEIMTYIEQEKSNIIRELRASATARKAVGAYASAERLYAGDIDSEI